LESLGGGFEGVWEVWKVLSKNKPIKIRLSVGIFLFCPKLVINFISSLYQKTAYMAIL